MLIKPLDSPERQLTRKLQYQQLTPRKFLISNFTKQILSEIVNSLTEFSINLVEKIKFVFPQIYFVREPNNTDISVLKFD